MLQTEKKETLERLIMEAIKPLIRELLIGDVKYFVSYLLFNQHNQMTDLIDSATEQYYAPGFLGYREAGSVSLDWDTTPTITIQMAMNSPPHSLDFQVTMDDSNVSCELIRINSILEFDKIDIIDSVKRSIYINLITI